MQSSTAARELRRRSKHCSRLRLKCYLSSNLGSGAEYNTLPDADLLNNQRTG
jgi:hypothetical protein